MREYIMPIRNQEGKVVDVLRCRDGSKWMSSPGCKVGLFRAEHLAKAPRDQPVFLCEGEWDTIALTWLLRVAKRPGVVLGVPGAGIFPDRWVHLFSGRDVYVCYDNDDAGAKGELKVLKTIGNVAKSVQFFEWRDDPEGCDMNELIREML